MSRIIYITGASGTGTSSLGELIEKKFDVNLIESDEITMLPTDPPFQFPRPKVERLPLLKERMQDDKVNVIVGSINDWGNEIIQKADMFILLYADFDIRKERIKKREQARFGQKLVENKMVKTNYERLIEWTSQYDVFDDYRSLRRHKDLYDSFGNTKYMFTNCEVDDVFITLREDLEKIVY